MYTFSLCKTKKQVYEKPVLLVLSSSPLTKLREMITYTWETNTGTNYDLRVNNGTIIIHEVTPVRLATESNAGQNPLHNSTLAQPCCGCNFHVNPYSQIKRYKTCTRIRCQLISVQSPLIFKETALSFMFLYSKLSASLQMWRATEKYNEEDFTV